MTSKEKIIGQWEGTDLRSISREYDSVRYSSLHLNTITFGFANEILELVIGKKTKLQNKKFKITISIIGDIK